MRRIAHYARHARRCTILLLMCHLQLQFSSETYFFRILNILSIKEHSSVSSAPGIFPSNP